MSNICVPTKWLLRIYGHQDALLCSCERVQIKKKHSSRLLT